MAVGHLGVTGEIVQLHVMVVWGNDIDCVTIQSRQPLDSSVQEMT